MPHEYVSFFLYSLKVRRDVSGCRWPQHQRWMVLKGHYWIFNKRQNWPNLSSCSQCVLYMWLRVYSTSPSLFLFAVFYVTVHVFNTEDVKNLWLSKSGRNWMIHLPGEVANTVFRMWTNLVSQPWPVVQLMCSKTVAMDIIFTILIVVTYKIKQGRFFFTILSFLSSLYL